MGTTLATYYAKLQDMPDSEYKVEILEDGPIKKIAVNGKIYEVDYNMGIRCGLSGCKFVQTIADTRILTN